MFDRDLGDISRVHGLGLRVVLVWLNHKLASCIRTRCLSAVVIAFSHDSCIWRHYETSLIHLYLRPLAKSVLLFQRKLEQSRVYLSRLTFFSLHFVDFSGSTLDVLLHAWRF